jgi:hypothetical protein
MLARLPRAEVDSLDLHEMTRAMHIWRTLLRPGGYLLVALTAPVSPDGRGSHRATAITAARTAGLSWQQEFLVVTAPLAEYEPLLHHHHRRHLHQRPARTRPRRGRKDRRHRAPQNPIPQIRARHRRQLTLGWKGPSGFHAPGVGAARPLRGIADGARSYDPQVAWLSAGHMGAATCRMAKAGSHHSQGGVTVPALVRCPMCIGG